MSDRRTFNQLDIFLSHYYVQTFNFDELDKLAYDFRYRELDKYYNEFVDELSFLVENKNWEIVKGIFKDNDFLDDDDVIENIVTVIYKALTDPEWNKDTYKPFMF